MNNVLELASGTAAAANLPAASAQPYGPGFTGEEPIHRIAGDGIRFFRPPAMGNEIAYGGIRGAGMLSQLIALLRELLSGMGSPQSFFQSATASSTGDPHLAMDATNASGAHEHAHFDSMTGHRSLLESDSFAGGYRISTAVTNPGANGVTYNRRATVSTGFGNTQVSLDKDGNASVTSYGRNIALSKGQSLDLGDGESVMRNADGSVVVRDDNGEGGFITTTLCENGSGVDVNVQAQSVDLGGDLAHALGN